MRNLLFLIFLVCSICTIAQVHYGRYELKLRTQLYTIQQHLEQGIRDSLCEAEFIDLRKANGHGPDSATPVRYMMQYVYPDGTSGITISHIQPVPNQALEYRFDDLSEADLKKVDHAMRQFEDRIFERRAPNGLVHVREGVSLLVFREQDINKATLVFGEGKDQWFFTLDNWRDLRWNYQQCKRAALRRFTRLADQRKITPIYNPQVN